jgi:hypothetical protein
MMSRDWWKLLLISMAICLCVIAASAYSILSMSKKEASDLFQQHVLRPIPASVTDVRVEQTASVIGYGYVFRFAVNTSDLEAIRKSRPFRQTENMHVFDEDGLSWDWKGWEQEEPDHRERGAAFTIHHPRGRPSWFDLGSWRHLESYALRQTDKDGNVTDLQILIYNSQLGQAYFIVYHYGGGL